LRGLEHLHARDIVHQDLKPLNVLLQSGTPRLTDFGVSRLYNDKSATSRAFGTYAYMPPEAFENPPKRSPQSDIWAAGVILYRLLTGAFPFPEEAFPLVAAYLSGQPPDEGPLERASVSPALRAAICQALTKDRARRYQTAAAMCEDLEKALAWQSAPALVLTSQSELAATLPDSEGAPLASDTYRTFAFTTPTVDRKGKVVQTRQLTARSFSERIGVVELEMVEIPGDDFLMGSTKAEAKATWKDAKRYSDSSSWDWFKSELPQRRVTVPPFFLGQDAVTNGQWRAVAKLPKVNADLNPEPSHFKGDDLLPADSVNWHEAQEFCARLTALTGRAYRLPSEAEWEYACRAGTTTPFAFGPTVTPALVNYDGNFPYGQAARGEYRQKTWPVFSGPPTAFGLYNMHGNLWEWCEDIWQDSYNGLPVDGSANLSRGRADVRVLRGGSWDFSARSCRSAFRGRLIPAIHNQNIGFRVALSHP
jgi:formylglycine-generating enzyme required for sulfatase activity